MSTIGQGSANDFALRKISSFNTDIRKTAGAAGKERAAQDLRVTQLVKVNSAKTNSTVTEGYYTQVNDAVRANITPVQVGLSQLAGLARELATLATQAMNSAESRASRSSIQESMNALVIRMDTIAKSVTNTNGKNLMTGLVSTISPNAATNFGFINVNNAAGEARSAAQANIALQAIAALNLSRADIMSLNSLQDKAANNTDTAAEFYNLAYTYLDGIKMNPNSTNKAFADSAVKVSQLGPLLFGVLNDSTAANGGHAGAVNSAENAYARAIAFMINESVRGSDDDHSAIPPRDAAARIRSANFRKLLNSEDVASLKAFALRVGAGTPVAADAAILQVADADTLIARIPSFAHLATANATLRAINDPASYFGNRAGNDVIQVGETFTDACVTLVNRIVSNRLTQAIPTLTPMNVKYGGNPTNVMSLDFPNATAVGLDVVGMNVVDDTGGLAGGVVEVVNNALDLLTAAQVSANALSDTFEAKKNELATSKEDYDRVVNDTTNQNSVEIGSIINSLVQAQRTMMLLIVADGAIKQKQMAVSEQLVNG
jgi:hypothetical protein